MIEAQSAPVSTAALATATGLHENTVRGHLEQLYSDGYISRQREAVAGRGRPAWLWTAARPDPENPYAALAGVLADTLAHTDDAVARAREAGRRWGSEIAARRAAVSEGLDAAGPAPAAAAEASAAEPAAHATSAPAPAAGHLAAATPPPAPAVTEASAAEHQAHATPPVARAAAAASSPTARQTVIDVMREQGFAPDDTGSDIALRRCPLIEAATKYPTIICAVHQGMIDGVLAAAGTSVDSRLIPFSAPGCCTLQLQVAP